MASIFDPSGLTIPDFFLVGPLDGGIEHLATMLDSHPDLSLPGPVGGVRWFSNDRRWNRGLVPYAAKFEAAKLSGDTVGDKSDTYLEPEAILRMFQASPTGKIVLMLQCPTHRWLTEQQKSGKTAQIFFDRDKDALAAGFYHGLTRTVLELWPFAQVWITTREAVELDISGEVGNIIDFLGADKLKAFNVLPFTKDHADNPVFEDILNGIYEPGFADTQAELEADGYTTVGEMANWCPPPPTPPVANDDPSFVTAFDTLLVKAAGVGVLVNDTDVNDTDTIVVRAADVTTTGVTANNGSYTLAADGSFSYLPDTGFIGADTFTYRCNDGLFSSVGTATVTITVSGP